MIETLYANELSYSNDKDTCWYKKICDCSKCAEDAFCIRHYKVDFLVQAATLEGKQKYPITLKPDEVDYKAFTDLRDIKNNIEDFVKDGRNLLIYSNHTGNGKTEWSKKLLLSWFNAIWPETDLTCRGLFVSMPKLMSAMKENISKPNKYFQHIHDNIVHTDLVVWDELNYKDLTAFELDFLLNVISQRVAIGKSNIYTTNYDIPVIEERLGTRLASRIIGCSKCIEFKGTDKRGLNI